MATLRNVLIALWVLFVGMEIHVATTAAIRACGECFEKFKAAGGRHPPQLGFHSFTFVLWEIREVTLCTGVCLGSKLLQQLARGWLDDIHRQPKMRL